jgi:hypothetical protein
MPQMVFGDLNAAISQRAPRPPCIAGSTLTALAVPWPRKLTIGEMLLD